MSEHFRQFGARSHIEGWQLPELDERFTLAISGLVERAVTVSLEELEASHDQVRVAKTMVCVFGLTSTAIWTGVPLRGLLRNAGVDPRAVRARFFGSDGFENNLRLDAIFASDAPFEPLVAFHLYDQRLPREHGFPFRLLLADRYGYKNIKWLERIELTDRDEPTGQYQTRGYSDAGWIEPYVLAEGVRVTEMVPVGPLDLCGFAVSGYAQVDAVELSIDGGKPVAAALLDASELALQEPELAQTYQLERHALSGDGIAALWSLWRYTLHVRAGEQRIRIRARDAAGHEADATELHIIGQQ